MKLLKILSVFILIILSVVGCQKTEESTFSRTQQDNQNIQKIDEIAKDSLIQEIPEKVETRIYNSKYLAIKDAQVNNHAIILGQKEFNKIYTKIDSTRTILWECGNPLDWLDKDWMTKKYGPVNKDTGTFENFDGKITTIYGKEIEFDTNNHIVLFNSASAKNHSFQIPSHHINLNEKTTLEDFKKLFPDAEIEKLENPNEVRYRFYLDEKSGDAFLFYFKNGKLNYFTLWWLLC